VPVPAHRAADLAVAPAGLADVLEADAAVLVAEAEVDLDGRAAQPRLEVVDLGVHVDGGAQGAGDHQLLELDHALHQDLDRALLLALARSVEKRSQPRARLHEIGARDGAALLPLDPARRHLFDGEGGLAELDVV
jgi:hypothetical protein